jgi:hypothetical protein
VAKGPDGGKRIRMRASTPRTIRRGLMGRCPMAPRSIRESPNPTKSTTVDHGERGRGCSTGW